MRIPARRLMTLAALAVGVVAFCASGCTRERSSNEGQARKNTGAGSVAGTVRGTDVQLANASFDGQLAIYEGDGWAFSPSLLVFLFLEDGDVPEGRSFVVASSESKFTSNPHVHYRWRGGDPGMMESEAVMDGYDMKLVFGQVDGDRLPGTIEFTVPGEGTRVEGKFVAKVENQSRAGLLE